MNKDKTSFDHLTRNLKRISPENSIFNYESGRKAFLSLGQGNYQKWSDTLLPNTRLILEPKIIGSIIGLQYIGGKLNKAINKYCKDITREVIYLKSIPKRLPIIERIEIKGVLYNNENIVDKNKKGEHMSIEQSKAESKGIKFCALQIFHCKINQFQSLQELEKLNFKIPQTHFTKLISEIEIYRQCWKEGKLFQSYPTNGIVLKVNSRKLQNCLGDNNLTLLWAYSIN